MKLLTIAVLAILGLLLTGCIPVTVRPEFDDAGLPKAIPVTPVGSQDEAGGFHPVYPVSQYAPTPPAGIPWETILQVGIALLTGAGGAGLVAGRVVGRVKTALQITADLADAQEVTSDPEQLAKNKALAAQLQEQAGVRALIKAVRGK